MAYALDAEEILVVANTRVAESVEIAEYYMEKRRIPLSHLVSVPLTLKETMSRDEYDNVLKSAVINALSKISGTQRIAAIVLIYGVPLKVDPPELSWEDSELLRQFKKPSENTIVDPSPEKNAEGAQQRENLYQSVSKLLKTDERAAVDSELALAKQDHYNLGGWIRNPYFLGFQGLPTAINKDNVLLVSRLDGPDAATVYRIINDTLLVEKEGLQGKAYFDARWPRPGGDASGGYQQYDLSLHRAADAVAKRMETLLDNREDLFAEKCCSEVALYCGWYSLGHYIDSFVWQKGAIGYHIASAECSTLRDTSSSVWCLKMLEKGVAATIGPVYEPYVQAFPLPELFFSQLIDGHMSLGESYLTSLPYLSWQMVLVGDPLYQPFIPTN